MSEPSQTDVIAVLLDQHAQIWRLFAEVEQRRGEPRREPFEQLVRLLAVHETAEQEVLHPLPYLLVTGGQAIADARLEEERHATPILGSTPWPVTWWPRRCLPWGPDPRPGSRRVAADPGS